MIKGFHHTKEAKKKIGQASRGRVPWNKGIPCKKETKEKLKIVQKGKHYSPNTQFKKGHKPWHANKSMPDYYKKSLSNAKLQKPTRYWLGKQRLDMRKSINKRNLRHVEMGRLEYVNWRRLVFQRDNFTCIVCEKVGGRLNAHHLKSWKNYPKLRYKINNGITLCKECHLKVHKV
ncbi:unnamed protein product, partial [marine sediment metagenome]